MDGDVKLAERKSFLNNIRLFIGSREKVFNDFKSKLFSKKSK